MATTDDVVRARLGAEIKRDSEKALAAMGLALPFSVIAPNAKTVQAIDEARSGKGRKHASVDAIFTDLAQ